MTVSRRNFLLGGVSFFAAALSPRAAVALAPEQVATTDMSLHPAIEKIAKMVADNIAKCKRDHFPLSAFIRYHPSGDPKSAAVPWLENDLNKQVQETITIIFDELRRSEALREHGTIFGVRNDPEMFCLDAQYSVIDQIPVSPMEYHELFVACIELLPEDLQKSKTAM